MNSQGPIYYLYEQACDFSIRELYSYAQSRGLFNIHIHMNIHSIYIYMNS